MDFIRKWLAQIQLQLANLSISQKMLIATLAIIIPVSLWFVFQYAASPMMAPVLDQPIDAARRAQIISYLDGRGIRYDTVGDRIRVPMEKRYDVLAGLQMSELLPEDTSRGFDALVTQQTWWNSSQQNRQLYMIAKQNVLAQIVRKYPWVRDATVIISMPEQAGFGASHQRPSASVNVVTAGSALDQKKVDAVAGLVSGSVAGMLPSDVVVIDAAQGRQWKTKAPGEISTSDYLEQIHAQERHVHEKITSALQYIRNVIVAVNVEVDLTAKRTESTTFNREGSVELLTSEENKTSKTTDGVAAAEPGVRANTGADVAAAAASKGTTTEETRTAFEPHAGQNRVSAVDPGGAPTRISATVNVPRSFFVALFKQSKPGDDKAEPKDDDLKPLIEEHLGRIKKQIEPLVMTKQTGTVVVDVYPDTGPALVNGVNIDPASAATGSTLMVNGMAKNIGLGALAMVSLTLMLMMVRKAGQKPRTPTVQELAGVPPPVPTEDELIGEAEESDPTLTGMELTEDAIRHRKLAEQVSEMVKTNPSEVATIVRRWIRKEE
jgi:flagellar M-ring protein FliF